MASKKEVKKETGLALKYKKVRLGLNMVKVWGGQNLKF